MKEYKTNATQKYAEMVAWDLLFKQSAILYTEPVSAKYNAAKVAVKAMNTKFPKIVEAVLKIAHKNHVTTILDPAPAQPLAPLRAGPSAAWYALVGIGGLLTILLVAVLTRRRARARASL